MTGDVFLCVDCQQLKPVAQDGATGYACLGSRVPSEAGHFVCYACADIRERADFATADRYMAYLSSDGTRITTWTGGHLAYVTSKTTRRVGFSDDGRTYIRATSLAGDGSRWYGNGPGAGMFVRLRRARS